MFSLSITGNGISAPRWHFDLSERLSTTLSQFLDDPRWIAMLAAVLTVSGPWLPARWRRWWWALLLAFVPIHLVVSAIVPARSLLGLAVGWFVGRGLVLVVGTPALGFRSTARSARCPPRLPHADRGATGRPGPWNFRRPTGRAPVAVVDLWAEPAQRRGLHGRSGGGSSCAAARPARFQASLRRASRHRALMTIAIGDLGVANTTSMAVAGLERGWTLYAHTRRGAPRSTTQAAEDGLVTSVWGSLGVLHRHQISHGDLRRQGRSPSTAARRCSAASATPNTARRTNSCNPTSPNC